jgi:hypothetical protein
MESKMQKILLIVVIIFCLTKIDLNAQINWVSLNGSANSAPQVNVSFSNNNNVSLTIKVNGFSVFDKLVNNESFQGLLIPDAENTMEEGLPQLPVITKLIAIPDCDDVSIQVITSNPFEYPNYNILLRNLSNESKALELF